MYLGSSDANESVHISLVQPGETSPQALSTLQPSFTYPIFGDQQKIFGYQGLRINLRFAEHNLRPHVQISYNKKFKALGDTKATHIEESLRPFVTPGTDSISWIRSLD